MNYQDAPRTTGSCNWCYGTPDEPNTNNRDEPCPCTCHHGCVAKNVKELDSLHGFVKGDRPDDHRYPGNAREAADLTESDRAHKLPPDVMRSYGDES